MSKKTGRKETKTDPHLARAILEPAIREAFESDRRRIDATLPYTDRERRRQEIDETERRRLDRLYAEYPIEERKRAGRTENLMPGCAGDRINTELFGKVQRAVLKRFGFRIEGMPKDKDGAVDLLVGKELEGVERKHRQAVRARIRRLRSKRSVTSQAYQA